MAILAVKQSLTGRRSDLAIVLVTSLVFCLGLAAQGSTFLNHDVAWVLYSSRWMLDGAIFGKDIVAANPPLIWWISLLPNEIASITNLPVTVVFRVIVTCLAAASLFVTSRLLYPRGDHGMSRFLFLIVSAWMLMFAVHRDFGQREHLTVILILPYLAALVRRAGQQTLPIGMALAIGACAGVGIALKPHFVGVPILLECWLLWRTKSIRTLVRPEALGAIAAVALYAIAMDVFARPWLEQTVVDIARVYWAFEQYGAGAQAYLARKLLLPLLLFALAFAGTRSTAGVVFFIAAISFLIAVLWQGKFYTYHVYPVYALLILGAFAQLEWTGIPRRLLLPVSVTAALVLFLSIIETKQSIEARQPQGSVGKSVESIAGFVEETVPKGGSFVAISTHPFPGFPTSLYVRPRWASRSNSQIFLPAVVRLRAGERRGDTALLSFAERNAHAAMNRDMRQKPDLVLVDISPWRHAIGAAEFDYVKFYREDPVFNSLWNDYVPAQMSPKGFDAYVRRRPTQATDGARS